MLDLIKILIDIAVKGSTYIDERKSKNARVEYASRLLDVYLRLLEVVAIGRTIVSDLEYFVSRCERYAANGEVPYPVFGTFDIQVHCTEQAINLMRLAEAIERVATELIVFSPDSGRQLMALVSGKRHALSVLAGLLGTGHYFTGATPNNLESRDPYFFRDTDPLFPDKLKADSLSLTDEWLPELAPKVEAYLTNRNPREQLDALENVASGLRALLVQSASLDDILWSTKDFKVRRNMIVQTDVLASKQYYQLGNDNSDDAQDQ